MVRPANWSIALPNLRTGLATLFILFALEYWNNLLWPLIVFLKQENFPLAVGITSMVNSYRVKYDLVLAGSVLATVPMIILFFILRRQFMEGSSFTGTGIRSRSSRTTSMSSSRPGARRSERRRAPPSPRPKARRRDGPPRPATAPGAGRRTDPPD